MEYKTIHATIFDPHARGLYKSKANDRAELRTVNCSNADSCPLLKTGKCILAETAFRRCIYGKRGGLNGPTKRANGCKTWVSEQKEKYADVLCKLKAAPSKMAVIGEYVYLPHSFMAMNQKVAFVQHDKFMQSGIPFVCLNNFTVETVRAIIEFKPRAMDGGEIRDYQKEQVPRFAMHLKEVMPDLYAEAVAQIPRLAKIVASSTMVGRKALIHSLKPGTVVTKYHDNPKIPTEHWTWDGEWLTSTDTVSVFWITKFTESAVKIKPAPGEAVAITDDSQVDSDTQYLN